MEFSDKEVDVLKQIVWVNYSRACEDREQMTATEWWNSLPPEEQSLIKKLGIALEELD